MGQGAVIPNKGQYWYFNEGLGNILVYDMNKDIFTEFNKQKDMVLLRSYAGNFIGLDSNGNFYTYPSASYVDTVSQIESGMIFLGGAKVKRVRVNFEGEDSKFYITVYNSRYTNGEKEIEMNLTSGKWYGFARGLYGDYFSIRAEDVEVLQDITVEMIVEE